MERQINRKWVLFRCYTVMIRSRNSVVSCMCIGWNGNNAKNNYFARQHRVHFDNQ